MYYFTYLYRSTYTQRELTICSQIEKTLKMKEKDRKFERDRERETAT